jgi:phage shock protein PspC (stress-responsive transcriptional regulator)
MHISAIKYLQLCLVLVKILFITTVFFIFLLFLVVKLIFEKANE